MFFKKLYGLFTKRGSGVVQYLGFDGMYITYMKNLVKDTIYTQFVSKSEQIGANQRKSEVIDFLTAKLIDCSLC